MGAREVFESMCRAWTGDPADLDELWAADVVVEAPFAAPGRPKRFDGRDAFVAFAKAGREAMRVRIEECRDVVVHQTTDPDVIVVEYVLVGRSEITGKQGSTAFIGVLRARDDKISHWREYQDTMGIAAALAG
ncbi:MAG: nuclear transport factor 2 family protein [Umezawaea sp.]